MRKRRNPEYERQIPTSYEVRYYIYKYVYPIRGGEEEVRLSENPENHKLGFPQYFNRGWTTIYFDDKQDALNFVRKNTRKLKGQDTLNMGKDDYEYLLLYETEVDKWEILGKSEHENDYLFHVAYIGFDKIPLYGEE